MGVVREAVLPGGRETPMPEPGPSISVSEPLGRTLLWSYALSLIVRASEIAVYALLIAFISAGDVGVYMLASAFSLLISPVLTWGADRTLIRSFSTGDKSLRQTVWRFTRGRSFAAAFILVCSGVGLWLFDASATLAIVFIAVALTQIAQVLETPWTASLRARGRQTLANTIASLVSLARLVGVAILLAAGVRSMAGIAAFLFFVSGVSLLANAGFALRHDNRSVATDGIADLSGTSLGLANVLSVAQNRADWILVAAFLSPVALAAYGMANKVYEVINVGIATGLITLLPFLCRERVLSRGTTLAIGYLIVGTGICCVAVDVAFGAILPHLADAYAPSQTILPLLMAAAVASALGGALYQLAVARRRDQAVLIVTIVSTAAQLLANLLLIPSYGIEGAAIGMVVLVTATGAAYSVIVWRQALVSLRNVIRFVALTVVAGAAVVAVGVHPSLLHLTVGVGLLALAAVGVSASLTGYSGVQRAFAARYSR
jgi:O-antigen/teichoic acid export membrane protein